MARCQTVQEEKCVEVNWDFKNKNISLFCWVIFFVMSNCPKGECVDAYWNFRKWKLGLKVFKLSVLSDSQNHSVDVMIDFDLCHD